MEAKRSKKREEASRESGKKSKGSATEKGLMKSSRNAMKHGALALDNFSKGKKGREERAIVQATVDSIEVRNDAEREVPVEIGMCRGGILRLEQMLAPPERRTVRPEMSEARRCSSGRANFCLLPGGGAHCTRPVCGSRRTPPR